MRFERRIFELMLILFDIHKLIWAQCWNSLFKVFGWLGTREFALRGCLLQVIFFLMSLIGSLCTHVMILRDRKADVCLMDWHLWTNLFESRIIKACIGECRLSKVCSDATVSARRVLGIYFLLMLREHKSLSLLPSLEHYLLHFDWGCGWLLNRDLLNCTLMVGRR